MLARPSILAVLAALIGFGTATDPASAKSKKELLALQEAKVTVPEAIAIAQREVPSGRLIDADLETSKGQVIYSIEILKDQVHILKIDLQNGTVIERSSKRVSPKNWRQMAVVEQAKVPLDQAVGIAEQALPGGRIASADVITGHRGTRYRIDIEKNGLHVVEIDPGDGRVVRVLERVDD